MMRLSAKVVLNAGDDETRRIQQTWNESRGAMDVIPDAELRIFGQKFKLRFGMQMHVTVHGIGSEVKFELHSVHFVRPPRKRKK